MNKFFALSAAAMLVAAPLAATADEAVRLETDKSTQTLLAGSPALAVGATIVIGGILFAVIADGDGSTTTLQAIGPAS